MSLIDIFLTAMIFAGVLVQIMILLRLERMHSTLRVIATYTSGVQAILVHKSPNETARPTDSYL